jgi:hypothetical protein
VSNTDFVKSGSYFTALFVVVFGMTTLAGFGGSFFITGFGIGLIETSELGSLAPFLGGGGGAGFGASWTTGFGSGLGGDFGAGRLAGSIFF